MGIFCIIIIVVIYDYVFTAFIFSVMTELKDSQKPKIQNNKLRKFLVERPRLGGLRQLVEGAMLLPHCFFIVLVILTRIYILTNILYYIRIYNNFRFFIFSVQ